MSAGDKNILAFANRNSLQHKQTRAYGAGAVCIKSGLFYEANNDLPEGTAFVEGTTGQTWKLVGSKPIGDWAATTEYKVDDQVFAKGALWECATAHTSAATFADTNWTLKAGLVNEIVWKVDADGNLIPQESATVNIGSVDNYLNSVFAESIAFYSTDGTYSGNIDADDDSLGIFSGDTDNTTKTIKIGTKNNSADMEFGNSVIDVKKDLQLYNNTSIKFRDNDEEWVRLYFNDNDLVMAGASNGAENSSVRITYNGRVNASGYITTGDGIFSTGKNLQLGSDNTWRWYISAGGDLRPAADDATNLGNSTNRLDNIYATNGTIQTSDERDKVFEEYPRELLEVWLDYVKPKTYKWKSSIDKKGESARTHFGVSAQDVVKAFIAAGLDWTKYGVVCGAFFDEEKDSTVIPQDFDYTDINNLPPLMVRDGQIKAIEMAAIRHKLGL